MTWFRVDDGFHGHRKVHRIPARERSAAVALWVLAGSWSSAQGTDGRIPEHMLRQLCGTPRAADSLTVAGLWDAVPGGWIFHDWTACNPLAADVQRKREGAADRQRRARERATSTTRTDHESETSELRTDHESETSEVRSEPDQHKQPDVTRDEPTAYSSPSPTLPSPALPVLPSEELPNPPRPPVGPSQGGAGAIAADDAAVTSAAQRWRRTARVVASEASGHVERLALGYGLADAIEIVRRTLADPATRSLGRLDTTKVPGYLPDLARAVQAEQQRHEEGRARGRPRKHPACDRCGAAHGDQLSTRTVTDDDGRVGPCPACRDSDGRAA